MTEIAADPGRAVQALREIAFQLERAQAPTYRVRAFRRAAEVVKNLPPGELEHRLATDTLPALPGIGPVTAEVIAQAAHGQRPAYLDRLLREAPAATARPALRAALRGDCHTHSDWSDGGSPPREMAEAARDLGHDWIALTDHSPRLTVASGLSAERLRAQLALVSQLNRELAPFRILTGIEVEHPRRRRPGPERGTARPARCRGGQRSFPATDARGPDDRADGDRGVQPPR